MSITSFFAHLQTKNLMANLVITLLTVTVSVAALIFTTQLVGPLPISINQVTTEKFTTFDVMGESEIIVIPDQAVVNLGFTVSDRTVEAAQDQANTVTNNIIAAVKELGVESSDIKTINYSIYPEYDYSQDRQQIIGYRVDNTVQVTAKDTQLVNQIIDTGTSQGANQVGGVSFTLSDAKKEELTREARKEAIKEAKESARELANLAGLNLGKVVNVTESQHNDLGYKPYPMAEMMRSDGLGGGPVEPTTIEPGSSTFSYTVYLSYETL